MDSLQSSLDGSMNQSPHAIDENWSLMFDDEPFAVQESSRGFCVMCECKCEKVAEHHVGTHLGNEIYGVRQLSGKQILVLRSASDTELKECQYCDGVFFPNRLAAHECGPSVGDPALFFEGIGDGYCLMCQFRCGDISNHWTTVHHGNGSYYLKNEGMIRTLIPYNTDHEADLEFTPDCKCGSCQTFTYRNRRRRICNKKRALMNQSASRKINLI